MLCGWPALSSQLLGSLPTVSTRNVLSPSQCPTEYPYHRGSGASADLPPTFLGSSRPSVQISRQIRLYSDISIVLPGMVVNTIPLVMNTILRGNPSGSQPLIGSLESATGYSPLVLCRRNCSCPQGVIGGTALSFAATFRPQKPVKSRRGAGPPGPVSPSFSFKSSGP